MNIQDSTNADRPRVTDVESAGERGWRVVTDQGSAHVVSAELMGAAVGDSSPRSIIGAHYLWTDLLLRPKDEPDDIAESVLLTLDASIAVDAKIAAAKAERKLAEEAEKANADSAAAELAERNARLLADARNVRPTRTEKK